MRKRMNNAMCTMAAVMLLCSAMLVGCGGKDDEEKPTGNSFTYDGGTYAVTKGVQQYHGFSGIVGSDANYVNLLISNDHLEITLILYVPDTEDRLVAGTYEGKSTFMSFSCLGGNVKIGGQTSNFTVATVTVALKGDIYTIDVAGVIKNGGPFTGNFTGELEWEDVSRKPNSNNSFTYAGKIVKIDGGWQDYYGHYYNTDANSISLFVGNEEGTFLQFELFVPNSNNKLIAGSYLPQSTLKALTCAGGLIYEDGDTDGYVYEISPSTVTVVVSGGTYTINVSGTLTDGSSITGNYTGELEWYDESSIKSAGSVRMAAQKWAKSLEKHQLRRKFRTSTGE